MMTTELSDKQGGGVRYIAGRIAPVGEARHPMSQPEPLLPPDIRRISASIEVRDYTLDGVNEAITQRYWPCVDDLAARGAQHISLAGFPIASQLGRARILELIEETARRTGDAAGASRRRAAAAGRSVAQSRRGADTRGGLRRAGDHQSHRRSLALHRRRHSAARARVGAAACRGMNIVIVADKRRRGQARTHLKKTGAIDRIYMVYRIRAKRPKF
jgi:hypothetical protein